MWPQYLLEGKRREEKIILEIEKSHLLINKMDFNINPYKVLKGALLVREGELYYTSRILR